MLNSLSGAQILRWAGLIAAFVLVPLPATAADAALARPLGELYDVALDMDSAILDFNMLLGENQSPAYSERLDDTLAKLGAAQKASAASLASSGVSGYNTAEVSSHVAQFIKLARQNRDAAMHGGAPENAVVDEMMQHRRDARKIIDQIYLDLEKRAGFTGSPLSEARELAMRLQEMASLYVENAAAAYVSNRSQDSEDKTIDQMAKDFSRRLPLLLNRAKGEEALKLGKGIQSKWKFIEHSMISYQENTVPYLVDRYAKSVVEDLVKLAGLLEKQQ